MANGLIINTCRFFIAEYAPTLEINTLEFPNEDILPTGYNITIICTSNFSAKNWGYHYYGQPYWIQQFFGDEDIGDCGGGDDNEDSKVCTYVIQNSTESHSGNYSCISHNQMMCTEDMVNLDFKSKLLNLDFIVLLTSLNGISYI